MKNGIAELLSAVAKKRKKVDKSALLIETVRTTPQVMTILKYIFKDSILWSCLLYTSPSPRD